MRPRGDAGFALLSVLWIMVGVSALGLAANLAAREAVASAINRADLVAAEWRAEECLERARSAIGEALAAARHEGPGGATWSRIDGVVAGSPLLAGAPCAVEVRPAGAALDLNTAGDDALRRLFIALGQPETRADSLADALADWRDADDVPRASGAEHAWYVARRLPPPRDSALADVRELARVRGFADVARVGEVLSVEPGRVPVNHAPPEVLAALPGFTPELVGRVMEMRARGERIAELQALGGTLSPGARDALMRAFGELAGLVATEPDAWIVRARAGVGTPPLTAVVEVRLVRGGDRAAIVRRKTWME